MLHSTKYHSVSSKTSRAGQSIAGKSLSDATALTATSILMSAARENQEGILGRLFGLKGSTSVRCIPREPGGNTYFFGDNKWDTGATDFDRNVEIA